MKRAIILAGLSVYLLASCNTKKQNGLEGAYALETSFDVHHEISGKLVGHATTRDTLYLQQADAGYLLTEHRWQKNDYDQDGWRKKTSSGSAPYIVRYDEQLSSLVEPNNFAPPIKVAAGGQELLRGEKTFKKISGK